MIKRLKKPCYVVVCDVCGKDIFGSCFESKQKANLEVIENYIMMRGEKHFCSRECLEKYVGLEDE